MKIDNLKKNQKGSTIIELALATVIMLIVAVGGAAFFFHGSGQIAINRNKRTALEAANSRLEQMRASPFNDISSSTDDYNIRFVERQGTSWAISNSDPGEIININGLNMPITTTVQFVDDDPGDGTDTYDYVSAVVTVGYRVNSNETVESETFFAP